MMALLFAHPNVYVDVAPLQAPFSRSWVARSLANQFAATPSHRAWRSHFVHVATLAPDRRRASDAHRRFSSCSTLAAITPALVTATTSAAA
jgi:hypothetical protein